MSKSTKAALLSALVFPGSGHIYLKRYIPGGVLIAAALAATYHIVSIAVQNALSIVEQIQRGEVSADAISITELATQQSAANGSQSIELATIVLILCWIIGIVDAYRLGQAQDRTEKLSEKQ